jgi:hypothetical protein
MTLSTKGFWETIKKCTMSTFADMKKALHTTRIEG